MLRNFIESNKKLLLFDGICPLAPVIVVEAGDDEADVIVVFDVFSSHITAGDHMLRFFVEDFGDVLWVIRRFVGVTVAGGGVPDIET